MIRTWATALAMLLCTAQAAAQEQPQRPWAVGGGLGYLVMGGRRPTGGLMPELSAARVWSGEQTTLAIGGTVGVAGMGGDAMWLSVLGGPDVTGTVRIPGVQGLRAGATAGLDAGRVSTCNDWGFCLPYLGLYPRAAVRLSYEVGGGVSGVASLGARYVNTLGWTGISWEPTAAAQVSF